MSAAGAPRFAARVGAITALALALRLWGLPGQALFADDLGVGVSASNFVERGHLGPTMWHHPHLSDALVYAATALAGTGKLGLVLLSLLFGVAAVPLLAVFTRAVTGEAAAALLAAFLLAIDPVHVDYSRQAVKEGWIPFFVLAGLVLFLRHRRTGALGSLLGAGLLFGAGAACKWTVGFALAVCVGWVVLDALPPAAPERARPDASTTAVRLAALGALPLTVYLLSFAPWFGRGYGLAEFAWLQATLAREQAVHAGFNPYGMLLDSNAWVWFLRPAFYADFAIGAGGPVVLMAVSNPVTWLATLPAMGWVAARAWRERAGGAPLLVALFLAVYLPFVVVSRPVWLHTALGVLPFALAAVAWAAISLAARLPHPRRWLAAYVATATLVAVPLYPLAVGYGLETPGLRELVERVRPPPELEKR
ncbi:MAG TPA: phospholipid carrier-dependent glycosyltransferase [Anaeromyxobacter sp.]